MKVSEEWASQVCLTEVYGSSMNGCHISSSHNHAVALVYILRVQQEHTGSYEIS